MNLLLLFLVVLVLELIVLVLTRLVVRFRLAREEPLLIDRFLGFVHFVILESIIIFFDHVIKSILMFLALHV